MSIITRAGHTEAQSILQGKDCTVLREIKAPGVAAALWQRKPTADFMDWIGALPARNLPRVRTLVVVDAVEPCVQAACDLAKTPRGEFRDMLADDIAVMARLMAEIMGATLLQLRLDVVSTNACRKFHIDNMTARMLCTYRGSGTQLALPDQEHSPMNVSTGTVALLRGKRWPGVENTALLHRSPPIEGTGETRLLVVIDPASEADATC